MTKDDQDPRVDHPEYLAGVRATASNHVLMPTYDDVQRSARLVRCGRCGRAFYMTQVAEVCIACR